MSEKDEKIKELGEGKCPHCGQNVKIKRKRKTVAEPEKGVYDDSIILEKMTQTRL